MNFIGFSLSKINNGKFKEVEDNLLKIKNSVSERREEISKLIQKDIELNKNFRFIINYTSINEPIISMSRVIIICQFLLKDKFFSQKGAMSYDIRNKLNFDHKFDEYIEYTVSDLFEDILFGINKEYFNEDKFSFSFN